MARVANTIEAGHLLVHATRPEKRQGSYSIDSVVDKAGLEPKNVYKRVARSHLSMSMLALEDRVSGLYLRIRSDDRERFQPSGYWYVQVVDLNS